MPIPQEDMDARGGEWPAAKIKALRRRHALTQTEMAERCGVTLTAVQKWEGDQRTPSWRAVRALRTLARERVR